MQKLAESRAFGEVQNILLKGFDPISASGFTQVPNKLLNDAGLSFAAKVVYGKLLSYAWHNNMVFLGQERMARELGTSQPTVTRAIGELQHQGWLEIQRRGQGKTNLYVLKHTVKHNRSLG